MWSEVTDRAAATGATEVVVMEEVVREMLAERDVVRKVAARLVVLMVVAQRVAARWRWRGCRGEREGCWRR